MAASNLCSSSVGPNAVKSPPWTTTLVPPTLSDCSLSQLILANFASESSSQALAAGLMPFNQQRNLLCDAIRLWPSCPTTNHKLWPSTLDSHQCNLD